MPGLPPVTVSWLEELATNPDLEHVLFDPGRLTFRTTFDRLAGYCEGAIRRLMLNLSPDQERLVRLRVRGLLLLKGCAGSGKTTVGIYRAIERAQQGRRVLMMTFNRTLNQVTRTLIAQLIGPLPANLEVIHDDRWVFDFLGARRVQVSPGARRELMAQAMAEVAGQRDEQVLRRSPAFFQQEIARVIKGNGIATLEQYLHAQRYGRLRPPSGPPSGPCTRRTSGGWTQPASTTLRISPGWPTPSCGGSRWRSRTMTSSWTRRRTCPPCRSRWRSG